jgi:hypothetical protein
VATPVCTVSTRSCLDNTQVPLPRTAPSDTSADCGSPLMLLKKCRTRSLVGVRKVRISTIVAAADRGLSLSVPCFL